LQIVWTACGSLPLLIQIPVSSVRKGCVFAGLKYRGQPLKTSIISKQLIAAAQRLAVRAGRLRFRSPVSHIYNPLDYAWPAHELYLRRFGSGKKRVVFLGMNPGPFGMTQTGIPFGEIAAVRDWMKIRTPIGRPELEHPKRPVLGFDCVRSEVSGRRLWQLFADRFGSAERFFAGHFVVNYCPLAFCGDSGCNLTPDKLEFSEREQLFEICNEHLSQVLELLRPEWLVGVGGFAAERGQLACESTEIKVAQILHPSPASPAANRGWSKQATAQLIQRGIWD